MKDGPAARSTLGRPPFRWLFFGLVAAVALAVVISIVVLRAVDDHVDGGARSRFDISGSRVVTNPREIVGEWRVIELADGPVPQDAVRQLWIGREGPDELSLGYHDGVNSTTVQRRLESDGTLADGSSISTAVGCGQGAAEGCGQPSGFGLGDLDHIELTPDGRLVMFQDESTPSAIYEFIGHRARSR